MLVLHARPIAAMLARRDAAIARHAARRDLAAVLEDRSLDVLAETPVDLPDRLRRLGLLADDRPALH
jgi:hypothetical protein